MVPSLPPLAWLSLIFLGFASFTSSVGVRRFFPLLFLYAAGTLGIGAFLHALSGRAFLLEGWDRAAIWACAGFGALFGWGLWDRMSRKGPPRWGRMVAGIGLGALLASPIDRGRTALPQIPPSLTQLFQTVGVVSKSVLLPGPGPSGTPPVGPRKAEDAALEVRDFILPDASGQERSFSGLTRGKPSLLAVYSGACAHCGTRLTGLSLFARELARAGIPVVGVEYMGTPESVRATLVRFGLDFPVLADGNGRVCGMLGIGEFTLLALDGERRVLFRGGLEDPGRIRSLFPL